MGVSYEEERGKYATKVKYPFSSARKRMSVVVEHRGENCLFIKGASEMVLRSCEEWLNHETNKVEPITEPFRRHIEDCITEMAAKSLRTLCLGYKKLSPRDDFAVRDEKGVYEVEKSRIVLVAIVGVRDNPRQEVP